MTCTLALFVFVGAHQAVAGDPAHARGLRHYVVLGQCRSTGREADRNIDGRGTAARKVVGCDGITGVKTHVADGVPLIAPVAVLKLNPDGNAGLMV